MLPRRLLPLLLLLAAPAALAERISTVTLFPDRAAVTREQSATLEAGEGVIRLEGLPAGLDRQSLRVAAYGVEGLTLGAVESRIVQTREAAAAQLQQLNRELERLSDLQRETTDQERALALQLGFIERLGQRPAEAAGGPRLEPGQWQEAWELVGRGAQETLTALREQERSRRELDREIDRLRREIEALGRERRQQLEVTVHYTAQSPGQATITLDYIVPQAGWTPHYEARLDSHSGELILVQRAEVRQATGEVWEATTLWLSTARPALGGRLPEPSPWYIDARPPQPVARTQRLESADLAAAPPLAEAEHASASIEATDFTARYRVPGRVSVPGDNSRHRFLLAEQRLPVELSSRVVPKASPHAYLYARGDYPGEIALPAGPLTLFQDGVFAGNSRLPTLAPGSELRLAFGVDDKIEVQYVLERDVIGQEGLLRRQQRLTRDHRIELESRHSRPIRVTVLDQLPVARDERIRVELSRESTAPDERDHEGRAGVVAWHRELPAEGRVALRFGYTVSWPEELERPWGL